MLAALVVFLIASQTGALSSLRHIGPGAPPAAAPANSAHAQMVQPATDSASQPSAISSGKPPAALTSGGPEDAGPDVVGQSPAGKSSVCAPKVCRR
jgi:hypothetical protein